MSAAPLPGWGQPITNRQGEQKSELQLYFNTFMFLTGRGGGGEEQKSSRCLKLEPALWRDFHPELPVGSGEVRRQWRPHLCLAPSLTYSSSLGPLLLR